MSFATFKVLWKQSLSGPPTLIFLRSRAKVLGPLLYYACPTLFFRDRPNVCHLLEVIQTKIKNATERQFS